VFGSVQSSSSINQLFLADSWLLVTLDGFPRIILKKRLTNTNNHAIIITSNEREVNKMKDKLMIGLVGMVCGILLVYDCMGISNLVAKDPNTRSVKATATAKY